LATKEEKVFNWFLICVGIFVGTIVSIVIFGNFVGVHEDEISQQETLDRLASLTIVAIDGEPEPATGIEKEVVMAAAPVIQSGEGIYNLVCSVCHTLGLAGAPAMGDASWSVRMQQGLDVIQDHFINGYQGEAGIMPAKGGRTDLTDEEILSALDHLLNLI
jgi:cytochrome c5